MALNNETIEKLRNLLASWTVFRQNSHVAHWDIMGQNFNSLHSYFEQLYTDALKNMDTLAERIRQMGLPVEMSLSDVVQRSVISDGVEGSEAKSLVSSLLANLAQMSGLQSEIFMEADEQGDYVTSDIMVQLGKYTEFSSWFLSSYLGQSNTPEV